MYNDNQVTYLGEQIYKVLFMNFSKEIVEQNFYIATKTKETNNVKITVQNNNMHDKIAVESTGIILQL